MPFPLEFSWRGEGPQRRPTTASAFVGQPITLTWSFTNATSCIASGAWNGSLQTSGSQSVTPATAGAQTYSV